MIIGTAGHIDHGKTALVRALTGVDTDRLKEEKARGISIDLGYAYAALDNGDMLGFVDVPGHERFIHNMLVGATGIDYVLLVVAADDGVMPQTWEHFRILTLLGLTRGAVALTKIDKVEPTRLQAVRAEIAAMLGGSALADSPIFPVSSISGAGVDALRRHLDATAVALPPRVDAGRFRLAIDRCFTLAGSGTIVTGTVFSGTVRTGDKLVLSSSGSRLRVRSVHAQNRAAEHGHAGQRCALNLVGAERQDIARGDWVLDEALHVPTQRLDAHLQLLSSETDPLEHWTPVHLHLAAARRNARVALLQGDAVQPGGCAYVQLVLDQALDALHGDRFVLRDQSARRTLGGGAILDPFAPARKRRAPARLAILQALEQADRSAGLEMMLRAAPDGLLMDPVALAWNIGEEEARRLWQQAGALVLEGAEGRRAFAQAQWQTMKSALAAALAEQHRLAPQQPGVAPRMLRERALPDRLRKTFDLLVEAMLAEKTVVREGSLLRLASHQTGVSPLEAQVWPRLEALFNAASLQPLDIAATARNLHLPQAQLRKLLRHWASAGRVYMLDEDAVLPHHTVVHFARIVRGMAEADAHGEVRLAEFRDRIQMGRRYAVKLLEFFDHIGFTRRVGDAHRICREAAIFKEL